jgi:hypothetical protein
MNKRDRMREQILKHAFDLNRIFGQDPEGVLSLCQKLHRLEARGQRIALHQCNVGYSEDEWEKLTEGIHKAAEKITGAAEKGIPLHINWDPRGYCLKIKSEYVRDNKLDIHRDWGGYGILAPEFDGRA